MAISLRDKIRPYKYALQHLMSGAANEFDSTTLPWIDDQGADIDGFLKTFQAPAAYKYDLKEKLAFWRENGYVILEEAIPADWCDKFWDEIDYMIEHHKDYGLMALVNDYNNNRDLPMRDIPIERLKGTRARFNDYHQLSVACKKILSHSSVATFLKAVFNEPVVAYQSLVFKYSSQQPTHQDFPWVTSGIPSHLTAAWIALEDVTEDAGPLFYYPGSHKMPKFNFGNGILYKSGQALRTPEEFGEYLDKKCQELGYEKKTLLLKKGDLLVWHAALAHGGAKITSTPPKSRKSLVVHYTTKRAYPTAARFEDQSEPVVYENNEIGIYRHPQRPDEEDSLKMGETWHE